ncbi:hypothetical protein KBD20_02725 [Candidatus Saccharibacteria bacterium]|nr:hypothetical protein [Candidatus Saccharibacteria bacterium]
MEQPAAKLITPNRLITKIEGLYLQDRVARLGGAILGHAECGSIHTDYVSAFVDNPCFAAELSAVMLDTDQFISGRVHYNKVGFRKAQVSVTAQLSSDLAFFEPVIFDNTSRHPENRRVTKEHLLVVRELTRRITQSRSTALVAHEPY